MNHNLRHLRVFLAVSATGSVTRAAEASHVTQPAVTQAIARLEEMAGQPLFTRTSQGLFQSPAGECLAARVQRAFSILDPALSQASSRLVLTATATQLQGLVAMRETENFTLAAKRLGIAQPTLHRTIAQLEEEAGQPLFTRTAQGMIATKISQSMAQAARLAFAELEQAEADLHELAGREVGKIVIGALPLSRSRLLPKAITTFRQLRPTLPLKIKDGPYTDLLGSLRRGEIDFMVGALREPAPIADVEQRALFSDSLAFISRKGHPILSQKPITLEALASHHWITGPEGTPTRQLFDAIFASSKKQPTEGIIESGSMILMRELLLTSDHLGCISRQQAEIEARSHPLAIIEFPMDKTLRPIGLTFRTGWLPTKAQQDFINALADAAKSG